MDFIDQDAQVLSIDDVPLPLLPIVCLGVEWVKEGSKWCCKVEDYTKKYNMKWLLIARLKKMRNPVVEKGKIGRLSTHPKGPKQQNHTTMNAKVLSDPIMIVQWNKQKAAARTRITIVAKWDWSQKIAKDLKQARKPPLIKVVLKHLFGVWQHPFECLLSFGEG